MFRGLWWFWDSTFLLKFMKDTSCCKTQTEKRSNSKWEKQRTKRKGHEEEGEGKKDQKQGKSGHWTQEIDGKRKGKVKTGWEECLKTENLKFDMGPVHFSSVAQSFLTLCDPTDCSTPGFPVHHQLLELAQIHVHQVGDASNHLILCCPLLPPPSVFPSISVFPKESFLRIRWPKYWSFSFSISPSNEHSRLISFRMDWLDLLAVQGTLKSSPTPQFKSINSLVLSFLYSSTLTSMHDYWKNHSFDSMDLCQQSNISTF